MCDCVCLLVLIYVLFCWCSAMWLLFSYVMVCVVVWWFVVSCRVCDRAGLLLLVCFELLRLCLVVCMLCCFAVVCGCGLVFGAVALCAVSVFVGGCGCVFLVAVVWCAILLWLLFVLFVRVVCCGSLRLCVVDWLCSIGFDLSCICVCVVSFRLCC